MFLSCIFSLQELQKEKNSLTVQLDQSSRRLSQLEEEKKSADQSLKRTQGLLDDIKGKRVGEWQWTRLAGLGFPDVISFFFVCFWSSAKSEGQAEELKRLQSKLEQQTQASAGDLENMKKTLSDAEAKNDK